jgi:hypothetical protein
MLALGEAECQSGLTKMKVDSGTGDLRFNGDQGSVTRELLRVETTPVCDANLRY